MKLNSILALAGLAMAAPNLPTAPSPIPNSNSTILHPDQIHKNIMNGINPDHIVHSDNLYEYFEKNHGANHTIYVNDTRQFIHLADVKPTHSKRQYGSCWYYDSRWLEQIQHWWDAWHPVSSCVYNGHDRAPSTQSIYWSHTVSYSLSAGLEWGDIENLLVAAAGMGVTESWSHASTLSCTIPEKSVGQVWIQNYWVWGWVWAMGCRRCPSDNGSGCGGDYGYDPTAKGGALAPVASTDGGVGVNYGCSTGYDKVCCNCT